MQKYYFRAGFMCIWYEQEKQFRYEKQNSVDPPLSASFLDESKSEPS